MIISVDFDGTLCRNAYPEIGESMPGARKSLEELRERGHYLIIWTCRTGDRLLEAVNWLLEEGIPFDRVNDHNQDNLALYGDGGMKVYADVYIDDKNLGGFDGWYEAMRLLRAHPDY